MDMRDSVSSLINVKEKAEPTIDIICIVLPISLIIAVSAFLYYWHKKRNPKIVEVQEIKNESDQDDQ
jgi:hypothetical protein